MGDNDDQADRMELDGPIDLYGEEICDMHHMSNESDRVGQMKRGFVDTTTVQDLKISSDQESTNSKAEESSSDEEGSFTYGHIKSKMTIQEMKDLLPDEDYEEFISLVEGILISCDYTLMDRDIEEMTHRMERFSVYYEKGITGGSGRD